MSYKILVVDDEEDLRDTLVDLLKQQGDHILTAPSGKAGFSILQKQIIDAVITDIRMPDGDGIWLIQQIQKIPKEKRPLIFVMTAFTDLTESTAQELGVEQILRKPLKASDFARLIRQTVNRQKS